MLQTPIVQAINPFMDQSILTMAGLIELIKNDTALKPVRRANVTSSIRRFCEALGMTPDHVPATHWYFRDRLKRFHPLEKGITRKRWQTIKSEVSFALKHAGRGPGQPRGFVALSAAWKAFWKGHPKCRIEWGLSRLARYCSGRGIEPVGVNDRVMSELLAAIQTDTFKTKPERLHRDVCVAWNKAVEQLPSMELSKVSLPSYRKDYTVPWDDLPKRIKSEAEAWLLSMSQEASLLADDGPIKPLRPASIKSYRYCIREACAGFVAKGGILDDETSLATLSRAENVKLILQFYLDRNNGKPSSMIHGIAHVLVLISDKSDGGNLELLKRYRKQMADRRPGMKPKPKAVLAQFADQANIEKLLCLPMDIFGHLRRKNDLSLKNILKLQAAVAVELLLMRPIRRQNLVELQIGKSIVEVGKQILIRVPAAEVKNAVELDHKVPAESAELIRFYIHSVLPTLGPNPSGWLFPGEELGRHKCGEQLGRNLSKVVRDMTGLSVYPHVFRHIGALLYLRENPQAFEIVRRVLGHKSLETTTRSYASFEDQAAVKEYENVVLRIRDTIKREVTDNGPD